MVVLTVLHGNMYQRYVLGLLKNQSVYLERARDSNALIWTILIFKTGRFGHCVWKIWLLKAKYICQNLIFLSNLQFESDL